jgi:glycosyltransferase involved in cell wall biosynthesis
MERLVDWDLVVRFSEVSEPLVAPVMGGQTRIGAWPRITNTRSHSLAYYQLRRKHVRRPHTPVRILYALQFFPQLSETFVTTEIEAMRQAGVDIAVWSESDPPVPFDTDVPVFRGTLADAVAEFRPAMVHSHSLYQALSYAPLVHPTGVPMTVRGHGFEFSEERLRTLSQMNGIRAVFEFPHFVDSITEDGFDTTKLRTMTACFNPDLYFPKGSQDRRLVIRAGLASPTKDMVTFVKVAAKCPRHRFVLVPCWSVGYPDYLDELFELNRSLGDPVEIAVNRSHAEVAALTQRAGIYLHTHSLQEPYGMPVSIAESMAAGCYIVARRCAAAIDFVGNAGQTYDTEDEAVELILATEKWTDDQWEQARMASIERAFANYPSTIVLHPLLAEWERAEVGSFTATA